MSRNVNTVKILKIKNIQENINVSSDDSNSHNKRSNHDNNQGNNYGYNLLMSDIPQISPM